eukprot:TRINITY_DN32114_c0_g1_i1.p1 TRINITY_DN32114_c0_g1~~TRINITY_DN32114_c0_g1_i1.p1  ORF type:complete len:445 (+),score=95.60 TRINITY_DN32114_c0_g1_i1:86-1420(+)
MVQQSPMPHKTKAFAATIGTIAAAAVGTSTGFSTWTSPSATQRLTATAVSSDRTAGARATSKVAAVGSAVNANAQVSAASIGASVVGIAALAALSSRRSPKSTRPNKAGLVRLAATETATKFQSLCKDTDGEDSLRRRFEAMITEAQEQICSTIEEFDGGAKFSYEPYSRDNGNGGGIARVLKDGNVFEKAGVNVSVVYGEMPQDALAAATSRGVDRAGRELKPGEKVPFFACGISSVMHPKNPHCPTMHFNYRYFETDFGTWWFGGGTDITPSYLDREDMKHFHGTYKEVCDKYDAEWYPKFKEWADRYFHIKHRGETRGLGGIFFDDFNSEDPETHFKFSTDCLKAVTEAYVPVLAKNRDREFTQHQKEWQLMRRGRYVEFNLVYDRGTIFGLKMLPSGAGRIESILMSLPETARWEYCHEPEPGTPESEIMEAFKVPQEWV